MRYGEMRYLVSHISYLVSESVASVVGEALGDLHHAAGAQTGCAKFNKLLRILQRGNAACEIQM